MQELPGYVEGVLGSKLTKYGTKSHLLVKQGHVFVLRTLPGADAEKVMYTATFLDADGERVSGPFDLRGSWTIVIAHATNSARVVIAPKP